MQIEKKNPGSSSSRKAADEALRSALRMDEEEEGQATSAVDPAPSRELPAQILNSTLYSNSMLYAVGTSQSGLDTSQYTVVFTGVVRRGGGNI